MDVLNEYSYIWESDKNRYVLVKGELEYNIISINKKELQFFLIEDDTLADLIIKKMLENGNKVYNNIKELQEAISIN